VKIQKLNTRGRVGQDMKEPKKQGGLNAEIQARIGHQLRAMYDDVVRQGVPERFVELIRKLDVAAPDTQMGITGDQIIKNDGRD
jgi:Anti-sigma factor NepR